ncbi:hypothetical protein Clacol_009390 [Clathrus columnatus]|uniref:non-specific serine/threonine protein kinase n=1 Tax=Clathrus columnatus TaxID=1419009 RepID=A0AAV5AT81_9AGAM|nr:hypothetical protein Clacol_009390 [Clathrus columnatus]
MVISVLALRQSIHHEESLVQIEIIHFILYSSNDLPYCYLQVLLLLLAIFALSPISFSEAASNDLQIILLSFAAAYAYRDIYPLFTYPLNPEDEYQGRLLWLRIGLVFSAGIFIPLFTPRQYKPLDPLNPQKHINPEQVASIASFLTWSYMDSLIWKAARSTSLDYEDLPPLADRHKAEYLVPKSEEVVKRFLAKKRHIFWAFMTLFSKEAIILSLIMILKNVASFIAPFALNQLLLHIQNGSDGAFYRPWTWVVLMFVGPMRHTTLYLEGILTQLVFDHSLRIRVKEETDLEQHEGKANDSQPQTKNTRKGFSVPVQFGMTAWFLYKILGWSALFGMGITIISVPIMGYVAKYLVALQKLKLQKTDDRIQSITDVLSVFRMIKLFGWENKVNKQIEGKRQVELTILRKYRLLSILNGNVYYTLPLFIMVGTFGGYTIIQRQPLTAATVFSSIAVFAQFRTALWTAFQLLPDILNVSLSRIDNFLKDTEVLDRLVDDKSISRRALPEEVIGFRNASFVWGKEDNKIPAGEGRKFQLTIHGDLFFRHGQLNLAIGPTGSGKTSLLMALLGEMYYIPIGNESGFQLPRDGGIALVVQEGWVQSGTIKECSITALTLVKSNILFGSEYDETRYKKVIFQCGLQQDLTLFEAGDNTEIGERGFTLSGGQNARVTLARAVYSKAEIILIDDILASLDVHTSRFITHNIPLVAPVADFVVSLDMSGQIVSQGSLNDALSRNEGLLEEVMQEQLALKKAEESEAEKDIKQGGKLVLAEEVVVGHISWATLKLYYLNMGGALFWFAFVFGMLAVKSLYVVESWVLGQWAAQYESRSPESVSSRFYLTIYAIVLLGEVFSYSSSMFMWTFGQLRAARTVHKMLISSVLGTTLRWLDTVPTARVIARCTQDIAAIDISVPSLMASWALNSSALVTSFATVVIMVPRFAVPGVILGLLGFFCGQVYMKAQLPIKRQMSNYRSPIIAHMNAMLTGLVSVRAYGAETSFRKDSFKYINEYLRPARSYFNCNRWINIRSEALGSAMAAILALYVLNDPSQNASNSGLALAMAVAFASSILEWVRYTNDLEVEGNSIERIQAYIDIVQEPKPSKSGAPPAYWPASGNVVVENLRARYSADSPEVLHNISFTIKSGEKVGVVGRTGSGKSTLTLSLLRCIPTEGKVIFDDINTESINLDSLRNSITIIPQRPELLTGTLRNNLDSFSEHSDATLNDALRLSGLFALQEQNDQVAKITLDTVISSGGANLSVGQRQILALARAILRGSKLLILDEATSAIDYTTDAIIQNSLREASRNASLLIIAHRLNTIMDADKIVVLDAGDMVEFDSPVNLLNKPDGYFKSLVDESRDREALYEMAEEATKKKSSERIDNIMIVDISPSSTISHLKSLIWTLRQPDFSYFSYARLKLLKVDTPAEDFNFNINDTNSLVNTSGAQSPLIFHTVSQSFNNTQPAQDHIHIVVELPPPYIPAANVSPLFSTEGDVMDALWKSYDDIIEGTLGGDSPSVNAESTNYRAFQDQNIPIHDGRYGKCKHFTLAPPIELYHPVFAEFKGNISDESLRIPQDIAQQTAKMMVNASQIQHIEYLRAEPTRLLMAELMYHGLAQSVNFNRPSLDHVALSIRLQPSAEASAVAIIEEQNELGSRGDASVQCCFSYLNFWCQSDNKFIREATCCPTFLVGISGPWIVIMGAVFTNIPIVQRLTDYLWIGHSRVIDDTYAIRLARIFYSLRLAVAKLHKYYLDLPSPLLKSNTRFFPSITSFTFMTPPGTFASPVPFRYKKPLDLNAGCVIFLATMINPDGSDGRNIIVKFAERYGEEPHRLLASKGLAPVLLFCGPIWHESGEIFTEKLMIVMEYIEGESAALKYADEPLPKEVHKSVRSAVELLADNNMVHGDLRRSNILITGTGKVLLIDFDWAGKYGEARYPLHLSRGMWVEGVEDYSLIQLDHDAEMPFRRPHTYFCYMRSLFVILKRAPYGYEIIDESPPKLARVPNRLAELKLLKVDIPAESFNISDTKSLVNGAQLPWIFHTISQTFNNTQPARDHIHILVELPPPYIPAANVSPLPSISAANFSLPFSTEAYNDIIEGTLDGDSPSVNAKSANYRAFQDRKIPIHDGRYGKRKRFTLAPLVELYHPVFAEFKSNISDESLRIPQDIVQQTAKMMVNTSQIQHKEFLRTKPTRLLMAELMYHGLAQSVNFNKSAPDHIALSIRLQPPAEASAVAIIEEKSELGSSGDASVQCAFSYTQFWSQADHQSIRDATCCPTFLIGIAGPWIVIMGAVFANVPIVQRLTDYLWIGHSRVIDDAYAIRLARIFYSLRLAVRKLHQYYLDLPSPLLKSDGRFFPSITSFTFITTPELSTNISFRYEKPLDRDAGCVTFLATIISDDCNGKKIVVKFTERYGQEAHHLLAMKRMAPMLLSCGPAQHESGEIVAGKLLIVMEYVEGDSAAVKYMNRSLPNQIRSSIRIAVKILADNNMVHGDLRRPNILITRSGEVFLIDFDWAGRYGEVRYPLHLSPGGIWVEGVEDYNLIEFRHDEEMVDRL